MFVILIPYTSKNLCVIRAENYFWHHCKQTMLEPPHRTEYEREEEQVREGGTVNEVTYSAFLKYVHHISVRAST